MEGSGQVALVHTWALVDTGRPSTPSGAESEGHSKRRNYSGLKSVALRVLSRRVPYAGHMRGALTGHFVGS